MMVLLHFSDLQEGGGGFGFQGVVSMDLDLVGG